MHKQIYFPRWCSFSLLLNRLRDYFDGWFFFNVIAHVEFIAGLPVESNDRIIELTNKKTYKLNLIRGANTPEWTNQVFE